MDPATIGVIAATLAAKALERAEQKTIDHGEKALGRLLAFLKRGLAGSGESRQIEALEASPGDADRIRALATVISRRADADLDFLKELEALVEEAGAGEIGQVAIGSFNVQNAGVADSEINISFGGAPPGRRSID